MALSEKELVKLKKTDIGGNVPRSAETLGAFSVHRRIFDAP